MANKLYRPGSTYTIPAVAYQPARPAYTTVETYTTTTPQLNTTLQPGWTMRLVENPDPNANPRYNYIPVWTGAGPAQGGLVGTQSTNYVTQTYTRTVSHPATPEIPGSPAQRIDSPPQGWTAFGHSIAQIRGGGVATFQVRKGVSGVAVGFSAVPVPTPGYGHIGSGLLFSANGVRNLRTGASYGTFVSGDEFELELKNGTLTLKLNGDTLGTDTPSYAVGAPLFLSAALYGSADEVFNPTLTEELSGTSTATFPNLAASSAEDDHGESLAVFPRFTASSGTYQGSVSTFAPLAAFSSDHAGGSSLATQSALTASSYGGTLVIEPNAESYAQFSGLSAASLLLVGETGTSQADLTPLWALSSDRPYGESRAEFSPMVALSYDESPQIGYLFDGVVFDVEMSADKSDTVDARDAFAFDVEMSADYAQLVNARDAFHFDVEMSADLSETTVDARDAFFFDVPMSAPGTGVEVWAVNMNGFGSTSFADFPFNSFAKIGDRFYGAKGDGIFELDGETDDGALIRASFSPGKLNFGTAAKKTVLNCYLGVEGAGRLVLKIEAEGAAYTYRMRDFNAQLQQQRFTLGKGLRTNYVMPTFYNEDGADFSVDSTEFIVADLSRKI